MKLSADQFNQATDAAVAIPLQHESRQHERVPIAARVTIIPCAGSRESVTVVVRNSSSSGIGILARDPLQPGAQFLLCLATNTHVDRAMLFTVRHCSSLASAMFNIGAIFDRFVKHPRSNAGSALLPEEMRQVEELERRLSSVQNG